MKKTTLQACVLLAFAASAPAFSEEAQGDWGGVIANTLRLTVHITKAADGGYHAKLGSPDQSKDLFAADTVSASATRLNFSIDRFKSSYQGEWDEKQQAWVGTFTQGSPTPLVLKRLDAKGMPALVLKRPQEEAIEKAARPYREQDVTFSNAKAGVALAGTFSVPPGAGPFPAVVLVHGSGRHKRDVDIYGHKIFAVWADHLTRQGIAVLRYDKRGSGASSGDANVATTLDYTSDAEAAVALLRTRPEVDQRRLGIVGHSEGGIIAPLAASRDPSLGFIVLLAGPAVKGDKLLVEQAALINRAGGMSEAEIAKDSRLKRAVFAALATPGSGEETKARARAVFDSAVATKDIAPDEARAQLEVFASPWFRTALAYDPAPVLRLVKQPVLAINGALDLQVPPAMNLEAIRASLPANQANELVEIPELNHLFQTARTGALSEYAQIEETVAPVVLKKVSDWILRQHPAKPETL
ncbi:alpha/beta hydrolase family protein [Pseudoduganella namucuonensis]|uniref:Serine aminopeptidase S33 domain-containing protein n=1 Tax=Pseudoduganella namucuonensis TaxID=1035707 RepID=A0A1I7IH23_9BURK|nr:alpha/beta hydrolase [Pseudoduganella namucuonensis]SFU72253.1 hypothetical protein SAMN05216552_100834 [Pseudoduganella namucuonensis]